MPCPDLDAIRTLRARITQPPWRVAVDKTTAYSASYLVAIGGTIAKFYTKNPQKPNGPNGIVWNAVFCAKAPTIIDELLAYVEELEGKT